VHFRDRRYIRAVHLVRSLHGYLADLTPARLVLWCYLVWWTFVVVRYFDPNPFLWLSSLGLSVIIGTALYISTAHGGATHTALDRWQVLRLFLMPFCVSSFAALIKGRGFILVFDPSIEQNVRGFGWCAAFCALVWIARRTRAGVLPGGDDSGR